jgi:hypothetical protein
MNRVRRPRRRKIDVVLRDAVGHHASAARQALEAEGYHIVPLREPKETVTDSSHHNFVVADGQIRMSILATAAAEFDLFADGESYTASDFVAWLAPNIEGTPERRAFLRARQASYAEDNDSRAKQRQPRQEAA